MFGLPIPSLTAIKWGAIGLGALALLTGGFYAGLRWELGAYEKLVAADAIGSQKAVQAALDKQGKIAAANVAAARLEGYAQGKLSDFKVNLVIGVPTYVTVQQDQQAAAASSAGCVTYGFVRVLAAAQRGVSPDTLSLPGGESDDACTGLAPSGLAATLAAGFATSLQNSEQLNALIAAVKANDAIATAGR